MKSNEITEPNKVSAYIIDNFYEPNCFATINACCVARSCTSGNSYHHVSRSVRKEEGGAAASAPLRLCLKQTR